MVKRTSKSTSRNKSARQRRSGRSTAKASRRKAPHAERRPPSASSTSGGKRGASRKAAAPGAGRAPKPHPDKAGQEEGLDTDLKELTLSPAKREERNEKIKELIKLAEAQGYLTYDDINETIPEDVIQADELESYLVLLRGMDIEIIESDEVDKYRKIAGKEARTAKAAKLDFFDDPIRMYLHQMGQVPLLTREQEVQICKRIEKAEI